jgi:hypothetical protein
VLRIPTGASLVLDVSAEAWWPDAVDVLSDVERAFPGVPVILMQAQAHAG